MKKLYECQQEEMLRAVESLRTHKAYLESAKTGCGKTLIALEAAKTLGLEAVVMAPQSVLPAWEKAAREQGVVIEAINYEKVRTGRTKYGFFTEADEDGPGKFNWLIKNKLVVIDEVHRCMGSVTRTSKMLMGCRDSGLPVLMLSATPCEDASEMKAIGYVLRLHNQVNYVTWAVNRGCEFNLFGQLEFPHDAETSLGAAHLETLRKEIYGAGKGGLLTREDMAGHFQECTLITDPVDFGDNGEIAKIYAEMEAELEVVNDSIELDKKKVLARAAMEGLAPEEIVEHALTKMLRARQRAEILKTPAIVKRIQDLRKERMSVCVFVNFNATIDAIRERLTEPYSQIRGEIDGKPQKPAERNVEMENFQRNAHRIILCNNEAGGTGVNLHDEDGGHPRVSLISPSFNAKTTEQVLGRIDRAGSQTPSVQIILAAAGTIEERVVESVTRKLRNLNCLHVANTSVPSHTMPPETEQALVFSEENPCGAVIEVPVAELAVPAMKKPRKTKPAKVFEDGYGLRLTKEAAAQLAPIPPFTGDVTKVLEVPLVPEEPAHAEYSPSSLKYFEISPMYRPSSDTNEAADKGTRIHLACETGNLDVLVDEERLIAEKMLEGVAAIMRRHKLNLADCDDHKEIRVTIDMPNGESTFGTCDRLTISKDLGVMIDFKTGRNNVDDPEINAQTQAYVAGAFQMFPQLETIHFYFIMGARDEILWAVYKRDQLPLMLLRISTIIARAKTATVCNPQPGVCDFCARIAVCQQLRDLALPIAVKYQLEGYPIPENVHASEADDPATRGQIMNLARIMQKWSEAAKHHITEAASNGEDVDGFYLLRMKGRASILSTPGAYEVLKDTLSMDDMLLCSDLKLDKLEDLLKSRAEKGQKGKVLEMIKDRLTDAGILAEGEGGVQLRVKKEKSAEV